MKGGEILKVKEEEQVKNSLMEQLRLQNKTAKFYSNLVDDYMSYWKLREILLKDIDDNGIRYKSTNGNGITVDKPNESVQNLQKTTATMFKILSDLNLKEPLSNSTAEDDYL